MNVTEICVTAGRKFADPGDRGTTLCENLHLKASLDEGDDEGMCIMLLQARAEMRVETHCDRLIRSLANRRSIQHVNDQLGDAMDGADEQNEEVKMLNKQLGDLKGQQSIFATE